LYAQDSCGWHASYAGVGRIQDGIVAWARLIAPDIDADIDADLIADVDC
jgi:hypothetical protein